MNYLLVANIVSFISACFTIASSWTKNPQRTYWYQVWQCLTYAVAAYFFGVYANIIMMLINAFRNYLVADQKYSFKWMVGCSLVSLVAGLGVNGHSLPGYLAVFMTVYYTISSFYLKNPKAVKANVAIDLTLWFIFDLMVFDVPSGIVDFISVVTALMTIWRITRDEKKNVPGRKSENAQAQEDKN